MAWSAPMTAVAGDAFTAAQFNTYVRDNLNATEIGLSTSDGAFWMSASDDNDLAFLGADVDHQSSTVSTSSSSYVTLGGSTPTVTLTTNVIALVSIYSWVRTNVDNGSAWIALRVSGATSYDVSCLMMGSSKASQLRLGTGIIAVTLNPGSNTFTCIYKTTGGGSSDFAHRTLSVIAL